MGPENHVVVRERYRSDFAENLRKIFDLSAWKRLHKAAGDFEANRSRWTLQALIHVGFGMALDTAPTTRERFEEAIELDAALRPKGRRCGQTLEGFTSALGSLPIEVFGAMRGILQAHVKRKGLQPSRVGRWEAFSLDGTKQNLPRTDANAAGFGVVTKEPPLPQTQTVAAVALGRRMVWDWESGDSSASERDLALRVIRRLPPHALCVEDAGFVGYAWIGGVLTAGKHVLLRVGANVRLWTAQLGQAEQHGGEVWLWPDDQRAQAPLRLRLIKVVRTVRMRVKKKKAQRRAWKKMQQVTWLLTDILAEEALTRREAEELFGLRWGGNEIRFRDWKCTLSCAVLRSRTPAQARRESAFSLCAAMLLQAMTLLARTARRKRYRPVSVALAVQAWRRGVRKMAQHKSTAWFGEQISRAVVDEYRRTRPKVKRRWPQRKEHRVPGTPKFRKLTHAIKALGLQRLEKKCA